MRTSCPESDDLETLPPRPEPGRANAATHAAPSAPPPGPGPRPPSPVPTARLSATFTRIIDLQPTRVLRLHAWWLHRAKHGRVRVNRLALGEPQIGAGGTVRLPGRLRTSRLGRAAPVDLTLWPWLGEWTKLSLEPRRHVAMTRRYFRRGHRTLDAFADRLAEELRPD
jgi:hypothetical protein